MGTASAHPAQRQAGLARWVALAVAVVALMTLSAVIGRSTATPSTEEFTGTILNLSDRNVIIQPAEGQQIGGAFAYVQGEPLSIGTAVSGLKMTDPDLIYIDTINE